MEAAQDDLAYYFSKLCTKYNISGDVTSNKAKFIKLVYHMHTNWLELDVPFIKTINSMHHLYNGLTKDYKDFIDAQERIKTDEIKLCMEAAIFLKTRNDIDDNDNLNNESSTSEDDLPDTPIITNYDPYYYIVRIRSTSLLGHDMLPNIKLFDSYDANRYINKYVTKTTNSDSMIFGAKFGKYGENIIEMVKVKVSEEY